MLPCALLGSWLVYIIFLALKSGLIYRYIPFLPNSITFALDEILGNAAFGSAIIFISSKIAPTHKNIVGYIIGIILFISSGFIISGAIIYKTYSGLWSCAGFIVGVSIIFLLMLTKKIDFDDNHLTK